MYTHKHLLWAGLLTCPTIGPHAFYKLYKYFNSIEYSLTASTKELQSAGLTTLQSERLHAFQVEKSIHALSTILNTNAIGIISILDDEYPELLKQIHLPPPILYYRGEKEHLSTMCLAVVGARQHTPYGTDIINKILPPCIPQLTIVSGLAHGIDAYAHTTAIKNNGPTIAVLASGLDNTSIYPRQNYKLAHDIIEKGILISESAPLTKPQKQHFPQRNRIIAGISHATLVIEATVQSGSLITAKYALEYNRDVLAVPGSLFNKLSNGTNSLIKQGAHLIQDHTDIANILHFTSQSTNTVTPKHFSNKDHALVYNTLNDKPTLFDEIANKTTLPAQQLQKILTELELLGHITSHGATYIKNFT